ncbi:MAG: NAD-dependent epimerase/dehydratase family protein [Sphingobium sp.]|nr:NAD-dependent epimerase/dehydratase family protein [Sphingobium sp.]
MSDKTIKVGMLGAGFILKSHATAVKGAPGVSLHVIADAALGRARHAAQTYGFAHAVGSIEEMAASDCDVVHILLPPAHHIAAARAMIAAGKHVFLEKPMGIDSETCALLCEEAAAKGLSVGVNHNFLFGERYEELRAAIKAGEIGRIDTIEVNWLFDLPQLRFGPFDNWMLAAPANILFEIAPHVVAFVHDLAGKPEIKAAVAGNEARMPSGIVLPRHWRASGFAGQTATSVTVSLTPGQGDRTVLVRGRGGSVFYDFGRDFGTISKTASANPMIEAWQIAGSMGKELKSQASSGIRRRIHRALTKSPDADPFDASINRSIRRFYETFGQPDARHQGSFAVGIMQTCEAIAQAAGAGKTVARAVVPAMPKPLKKPTVLVVGATGFIGRGLVEALVAKGHGVRVLSRSANAAAFQFADTPVEIMGGAHGDPETAKKALEGIDTVYHLAKCDGKRWQDYIDGDIEPTRVLGEAALAAGVKRFIYTGTIDSYASADPGKTIDSSTPVDPAIAGRNLYARSKAACEELLREMGLPLVILRPAVVVGPGSPPAHLGVGRFTGETRVEYWGDGRNFIPLVSVKDVVSALVLAAEVSGIEGKQFVLSSPPLLTARDYVHSYEQLAGIKVEQIEKSAMRYWIADWGKEFLKNVIRHPNRRKSTLHDWACKAHRARYDSSDAEAALGWTPIHDRQAMIDEVIAPMIKAHLG